jgi:hypothetical protein
MGRNLLKMITKEKKRSNTFSFCETGTKIMSPGVQYYLGTAINWVMAMTFLIGYAIRQK